MHIFSLPSMWFVSPFQMPASERAQTRCQQNFQNKFRWGPCMLCAVAPTGDALSKSRGEHWRLRLRPSTAFFSGSPDQSSAQSQTLINAQKHHCSDWRSIGHEGDCCFSKSKCCIFFPLSRSGNWLILDANMWLSQISESWQKACLRMHCLYTRLKGYSVPLHPLSTAYLHNASAEGHHLNINNLH